MSNKATTGRWWSADGWVNGICHHDRVVAALDPGDVADGVPMYLPAPVDLHVHGGGGYDCMSGDDAIHGMLRSHAQCGTGALLATSVTAPAGDISRFIDSVERVMQQPDNDAATLLGAHLEGPFISTEKLGAQPPAAIALNIKLAEAWLQSGVVKVITYAPECDPEGELLALCNELGVCAQLGHTNCSWAEAQKALSGGAGITHLYNAMSSMQHRLGGCVTAALAYANYAEIITDGVHVDEAAFAAARRAVPNLYSVTDATAATNMPDGEYQLGSLTVQKTGHGVHLADGTIAGSCLTQRRSIEVLRSWNLDWHTIGSLVSERPAQWIRDNSVGRIGAGALAHWLEIREDKLVAFWLGGQRHEW